MFKKATASIAAALATIALVLAAPIAANAAWEPQSTLTLSGQSCAADEDRTNEWGQLIPAGYTELVFNYDFAEGEGIAPIVLDGNTLPGDAGGFTVSAGEHVYSYTVLRFDGSEEPVVRGPFTFTVEVCGDEPATPVSPTAPTIDNAQQTIVVPADPNFTYALETDGPPLNGQPLNVGPNLIGPYAGVVIAIPKDGVTVADGAVTRWPFDFTGGAQPPITVTPQAPTQLAGSNNVTIPSQDGVIYMDENGAVVSGTVTLTKDVCFTAEPDGVDFASQATTRWCFTYYAEQGDGGGTTDPTDTDTDTTSPSNTTGERLAETGTNLNTAVPVAAAVLVAGGLLMLLRRRSRA